MPAGRSGRQPPIDHRLRIWMTASWVAGWVGSPAATSASPWRTATSGLRIGSARLELAEAYPLRDYIPALDPMPDGSS